MNNVDYLIAEAERLKLELGAMASMSPDEIAKAYNGPGPERWPPELRNCLAGMCADYLPAILIHDCDFTRSDGERKRLEEVTARFRRNTRSIYRQEWPLFTLRMFNRLYRAEKARALVVMGALNLAVSPKFSRPAWEEAWFASYCRADGAKEEL